MSSINLGMGGVSVMHSKGVLWQRYLQSAIYATLLLITVLMAQSAHPPDQVETARQGESSSVGDFFLLRNQRLLP
ncbi:MAG: hypothetical protein F6K03_13055 [Kamptonema sp. SIO4C4]|nr:hypothetical protein [Kamptonema sp. SIO4C4]